MKQSIGAMIAKIAIGLVIIICATGDTIDTFLFGLVVGGALIAWGLVPYIIARKAKKNEQDEQQAQEGLDRSVPKQCPNCGAYSTGKVCEYCGSPLQ